MTTQAVKPATAEDVLRRVTELVPTLRSRARQTELGRCVPEETLQDLRDAGVFRLSLPIDRGGFEADTFTVNEVLAQISRADPSTGWVCSLIVSMNTWVGFLPDEGADELLDTPDLRVTGLIAPTGKATKVEGGYTISGTWFWNTGGKHSNWLNLACMAGGPTGPIPVVGFVPTAQVSIEDTWHAFGMAGTATNKVSVEDIFVPDRLVMPISAVVEAEYPPRRYDDNPYFNRAGVQVFLSGSAGALVGIARGAMDVFLDRLPGRSITYTSYASAAEAPVTHFQVAEAQHALEIAEMYMRRIGEIMAANLGHKTPMDDRVRIRAYMGQIASYVRTCATLLFEASGASAIQHSVDIQRYFRDAHALASHGLHQPNSALELYGRHLVGLEPNSAML